MTTTLTVFSDMPRRIGHVLLDEIIKCRHLLKAACLIPQNSITPTIRVTSIRR